MEDAELHYWENIYSKWQPQSNFLETGLLLTDSDRYCEEMDYVDLHFDGWENVYKKRKLQVRDRIKLVIFENRSNEEVDQIYSNWNQTLVLETNVQRKMREDKKIPSNKDREVEAKKRAGSILSYEDWLTFIEEFPWQNPLFTYSLK